MARSVAFFLFFLAAFRASADVLIVVVDQELSSPLEGVQVRLQGLDQSFVTNDRGEATAPLPAGHDRIMVTAQLLGYKTLKAVLPSGQGKIVLSMILEGAVEGEELVVEGERPQKTDAQGGLSQVASSADIQAQTMGLVEDAMSAVKTLPGVGYAGIFDASPSINGGDPNETVAALDGAYVLDPYQWSGTYTIFNPDMVDSIKLSDGIIGAPYGQVMSGLLEVASKTPTDSDRHLDFGFSTTGLDLFYQQPFGDKGGMLLGGKITWMEVPLTLIGEGSSFATEPYIRDGSAKFYWNPSPTVNWTLNANLDTDGVALDIGNLTASLDEKEVLVSSALKVMMGKNLLWNLMVSYNSLNTSAGIDNPDLGNSSYSSSTQDEYRYQIRTSFDWTPTAGQVISYGLDEMLENWSESESDAPKNTLTSGIYIDDDFSIIPGTLAGEGGLRIDHSVVYGGGELLQTYPVINPRLRLTYTFLKDWGPIRSMDLNGGTGLYSQFLADNSNMDAKYGVKSLNVGPTRAWFNVAGLDIQGTGGETLNLQGYLKNYMSRFYTAVIKASGDTELKNDGSGYAYGFDLGLKKQTASYDFSLSYSFDVTEFYNPGGTGLSPTDWTSPLGTWYFPYYQEFNTIYIDLTIKPLDGFSVLTQGSIASGTPISSGGRTNWVYPVDLKLDWHGFYAGSKCRWEAYFGCENIFALLYSQRMTTQDPGVSFNIGYPIPSVGYKLSF